MYGRQGIIFRAFVGKFGRKKKEEQSNGSMDNKEIIDILHILLVCHN